MVCTRQLVRLQRITKITKTLRPNGGKCLKRTLTYLSCTKYNEINICHSDEQKHISYTESHKRFLIHYDVCLVMAAIISIILNFNALCDVYID